MPWPGNPLKGGFTVGLVRTPCGLHAFCASDSPFELLTCCLDWVLGEKCHEVASFILQPSRRGSCCLLCESLWMQATEDLRVSLSGPPGSVLSSGRLSPPVRLTQCLWHFLSTHSHCLRLKRHVAVGIRPCGFACPSPASLSLSCPPVPLASPSLASCLALGLPCQAARSRCRCFHLREARSGTSPHPNTRTLAPVVAKVSLTSDSPPGRCTPGPRSPPHSPSSFPSPRLTKSPWELRRQYP